MFYFNNTRKPDFRKIISITKDYNKYWQWRGFEMSAKLRDRELIFLDWINKKAKVLDIGCGNSRLAFELKNRKNCRVKVTDVSSIVINSLKQKGLEGFVLDLDKDFEIAEKFDYVILSEVLGYFNNPESVINKLKESADYFVISIPNIAFYRYRICLFFNGRFPAMWALHPSENIRFWSHTDFISWLQAMDLEVISVKTANGFLVGKNIFKNLLAHQICYLAKSKNN